MTPTPLICGQWDGVNLWVQWDQLPPSPAGWWLEVALSQTPDATPEWMPIGGEDPLTRTWMVIPTFREGWHARARVGAAMRAAWVEAQEVTFSRSRCRFEIRADRRRVHYLAGTQFAAVVDGSSCIYTLEEEVDLEPGGIAEGVMTAALSSGYCQLDRENDFVIRPSLGLCIRNLEPSVDDVTLTGRSYTTLCRAEVASPVMLVVQA